MLMMNSLMSDSWLSRIFQGGGGTGLNTSTLLIGLSALLFILVGISYYYFYVVPSNSALYRANKELVNGGPVETTDKKEAEVLLFYADWCPHSKKGKLVWDEIREMYETKHFNGYSLVFTEIDCSSDDEQTKQMINNYNIEAFPTIKLLKDGQVIEYDAKPTRDTLIKFFTTVLT